MLRVTRIRPTLALSLLSALISTTAFAAGEKFADLPTLHPVSRMVSAMFTNERDGVITGGTLYVGGVQLVAAQGTSLPHVKAAMDAYARANIEQVAQAKLPPTHPVDVAFEPVNQQAVSLTSTFYLTGVLDGGRKADPAELNAMNRKLFALMGRLGKAADGIMVARAYTRVYESNRQRQVGVKQVIFINPRTNLGAALFMIEGRGTM